MRLPSRRATALLAPALAGSLAVAAPAAGATAPATESAPSAKRESVVTLTAQPLWSGTNERLYLTGEVFDGATYRPLTSRSIVMQSRVKGTTTWSTIARLESNENGTFRLERRADRSRDYRAIYSGNSWYASDQSNWERQTATAGTKVRMSARLYSISTGTAVRGRATKLWSSTVRPLRGANVSIQARRPYGSYWFDAGRTVTDANGYYTWKTATTRRECFRYRAIYKGNSTWAAKSVTTYWSTCS